jgi:anti-anti-sigma factor
MTRHEFHNVSLLQPRGNLWESRESEAMESMLVQLAARGRRVLVDLSSTGHLTAHGLGVLAHAQKIALEHGGEIAICGARRAHRILIERTGVSQVVKVHADRRAALEALTASDRAVA